MDMREKEVQNLLQNLLEIQRDMLALNNAKTTIRAVLPAAAPTCIHLDSEIMVRFQEIRRLRVELGKMQKEGVQNVG